MLARAVCEDFVDLVLGDKPPLFDVAYTLTDCFSLGRRRNVAVLSKFGLKLKAKLFEFPAHMFPRLRAMHVVHSAAFIFRDGASVPGAAPLSSGFRYWPV